MIKLGKHAYQLYKYWGNLGQLTKCPLALWHVRKLDKIGNTYWNTNSYVKFSFAVFYLNIGAFLKIQLFTDFIQSKSKESKLYQHLQKKLKRKSKRHNMNINIDYYSDA